jgi:hypothetical protein
LTGTPADQFPLNAIQGSVTPQKAPGSPSSLSPEAVRDLLRAGERRDVEVDPAASVESVLPQRHRPVGGLATAYRFPGWN